MHAKACSVNTSEKIVILKVLLSRKCKRKGHLAAYLGVTVLCGGFCMYSARINTGIQAEMLRLLLGSKR